MKSTEIIMLSEIVQSDTFRCREQEDIETIEKYTEIFKEYKERFDAGENPDFPFPAITVMQDGEQYTPITGYHRIAAARNSGLTEICAKVFEGTEEEALLFAMKDNSIHGLPLKRGDLKYCITKLHNQYKNKSDGVIADKLGCSRQYVSKIRSQLATSCELPIPETQTGLDGKERQTKQKKKNKTDKVEDTSKQAGEGDNLKGEESPKPGHDQDANSKAAHEFNQMVLDGVYDGSKFKNDTKTIKKVSDRLESVMSEVVTIPDLLEKMVDLTVSMEQEEVLYSLFDTVLEYSEKFQLVAEKVEGIRNKLKTKHTTD